MMFTQWQDFIPGRWMREIDVRDFIQKNYRPYDGDDSFLCGPSPRTRKLWDKCKELLKQERSRNGVLEVDANTPITINSHPPGYI
ncbi:MAG: formate acetyltransferase, partial [Syntrophomonadaceae bacterium]|nr:formate acetyltransferase [Syntrophomonadaceae bacterium]